MGHRHTFLQWSQKDIQPHKPSVAHTYSGSHSFIAAANWTAAVHSIWRLVYNCIQIHQSIRSISSTKIRCGHPSPPVLVNPLSCWVFLSDLTVLTCPDRKTKRSENIWCQENHHCPCFFSVCDKFTEMMTAQFVLLQIKLEAGCCVPSQMVS